MARVEEIMTRDVVAVAAGSTLRSVVETLRGENVGGAPVVAGEEIVGVVSAADVLDFAAENPGVPTERSSAHAEWGEAEEVSPGWVEGEDAPADWFVDLWADAGGDVRERFDAVEGPEWDLLENHTVDEVMTPALYSLPRDAGIREAARTMVEAGIHRLIVVDDGALVGIVTTTDIVRAVAEGKV